MPHSQIVIIGGGPAGASAAIYLARFNHDVTLFDAPNQVHGRTSMAPDIHNFLTYSEPIKGPEFIEKINTHLSQYPIKKIVEKVIKVEKNGDTFIITTDKNTICEATYLILAVGLSDNMPEIDGLDPYYDNAIYHCLTCDWHERRHKKLAVAANTDRGIDTALMLANLHMPPKLVVIPTEAPSYSPAMMSAAEAKNIQVYTSPLASLIGENGFLHAVKLQDGTEINVEVLFTKLGHKRFDHFLDEETIKIEREPSEGFIKVDWRTFETSAPNLFAVGPCNEGPDQAIISAGEGALAALEIHRRIINGEHSIK